MNHDIPQIEDNPSRTGDRRPIMHLVSLFEPDRHVEIRETLFNALGNGLRLPVSVSRADYKIITEVHHTAHIEDNDILGFFQRGKGCDSFGEGSGC